MKFKKVVIDETYIGRRKYHKGHLVRLQAYWVFTITEVVPSASHPDRDVCGRVMAYLVPNRERDTLAEKLVHHLDTEQCEIYSDSAKFYKGATGELEHETAFIRALRNKGYSSSLLRQSQTTLRHLLSNC